MVSDKLRSLCLTDTDNFVDILIAGSTMGKTLILILEDVAVVRRHIIELLFGLKIDQFFEANSTHSAIQAFEQIRPQIAILDIQVPGTGTMRNGIDVLRWICKYHPETAVIMLTNNDQPIYRSTCLAIGAVYFFDKSSEFHKLHDAVELLLAGKSAHVTQ